MLTSEDNGSGVGWNMSIELRLAGRMIESKRERSKESSESRKEKQGTKSGNKMDK